MVYFTEKEKELTHGIYHDMADAVAAAVARRETAQPTVYVAAYMHRFGIDFTAHATQELAERRLAQVVTAQCARDDVLRERVIARFGAWPAQDMQDDALRELIDGWHLVAEGEALWVAECDVEAVARHDGDASARPVTKAFPAPTDHPTGADDTESDDDSPW